MRFTRAFSAYKKSFQEKRARIYFIRGSKWLVRLNDSNFFNFRSQEEQVSPAEVKDQEELEQVT